MRVMLLSLPGIIENDGNLFPLGIGYLSGCLKPSHTVEAFHYNSIQKAWREIDSKVKAFKPQIIGLTCSTFNRGNVKKMIRHLKNLDHNIIVVVGGVHASFCNDQVLTHYGADVVVIGEGERVFPELCGVLENNGSLATIKGIAFKENGEIILTPPSPPIDNLDELPMPDYSYARSFIQQSQMGFIITSRGCPVRCTFCSTSSYWGQKVRMSSVSRVVDEMEMLISQYQVKKIFFHDDSFNLGTERVKAICKEIIARKIKIEWACSCRVIPASEEMIAHMVEAGCRHICWGIESGSEEMLKKINKKITRTQIYQAYELSKAHSSIMSTGAFTMVGNPGESAKTVQDTIDFLHSLPITDLPSTSILYVLPGTLLYERLRNEGHIRDEEWHKHDTVPSYTMEHSFLTLAYWAKRINRAASRLPFDEKKHFWYRTLDTSDLDNNSTTHILLNKIRKVASNPQLMAQYAKSLLPPGRIRF